MKLKDLTGQRFGRLVVLKKGDSKVTPNGTLRTMWVCKCDCGNIVSRSMQNLFAAKYPSCGCWKKELTSERKLEDLTGQHFGRLTVIERDQDKSYPTKWQCKCECGNICIVFAENLKKGHTTSCGCFREQNRPKLAYKHGQKHTRIYAVWEKVKARCCNDNNPSYSRYGGRGITICDEWKNDPMKFIEWAYETGYDENAPYGKCTLERIDNNKGYSPDNCKWTTNLEQQNNKRTNVYVDYDNQRHTIAEWSRILNIPYSKLREWYVKGKNWDQLIEK